MLNTPATTMVSFPATQYFAEEHKKKQIYLHHTAGGSSGHNVFKDWANSPERVGTCVAISGSGAITKDGEIVQGFSSKHWAYHLGLELKTFTKFKLPFIWLDKTSIGIEVCNFGYLTEKNGKFYTYVGTEMPKQFVTELDTPHRGFKYFHRYTDNQIESVKQLLLFWSERYGIPLDYNNDIWDLCPRALRGDAGVFTHNSVRADKTDIYPCPRMIAMLKSLTKNI